MTTPAKYRNDRRLFQKHRARAGRNNIKIEISNVLNIFLNFGHLEFEFVSSFGLPAMPVSKSTVMPENIIVPPTTSRNTSLNAWQAGIRISDFKLVFQDTKRMARLCK